MPELPYTLWEAVAGTSAGSGEFRAEEIVLFRMLAQVADGWVRYDPAKGPVFVSRRKWLRKHAIWKRGRARRKKRLAAA
ncbi:MAG: hypothetical protein EXS39_03810 [Opitutaceae bacterium]|nr:hypothetical protein [Opitutaceae bacterium]